MPFYNLAAEVAALLVVVISMTSFLLDNNKVSTRYSALKWFYIATFASIGITLVSLWTTDNYTIVPLIITDIFKYLYFFTASIAAVMALYYAITLNHYKNQKFNFFKQYVWAWLPYAIYCVFIATNFIHRLVFTISPTEGYIRGEFFKVTYVIALIYYGLIIYFTIKNFKTPQRNALLMICFNLLVATLIFCTQLFIPSLQLSGIASVCGALIIHFYVQNVSRTTDSLTELYNRQELTIQMTKLCDAKTPFNLIVFSLRNFKGINERNGLTFGDTLLEHVALRLRNFLPAKCLFRYSGDEFAMLIPSSQEEAIQNIGKYLQDLEAPYLIDNTPFLLDILLARIEYPLFGTKTEELISAMDYSIYLLKKNPEDKNIIYDPCVPEAMKRRHYIIERLKYAIEHDDFEAYYQPIYSVKGKNFPLAEALIRFKASNKTYVSPAEFIPIAEETGMILKITSMMLELVCADYRKLLDTYGEKLPIRSISVNFPYVYIMKNNAEEEVLEIVRRYNLHPSMIKIELTERTFAKDIDKTIEVMNEFIEKGFIFELDDFGVEYSNFGMFFNVPINIIKFDRSLVINATSTPERREFFKQFLFAMKKVDMKVVMEGVEDTELLNFLADCGSDYIQGFVFSKPLPLNEFSEYIKVQENQA